MVESFEKLFNLEGKSPALEITVEPGVFADLSLRDAALRAMHLIGKPATTRQIPIGLTGHGSENRDRTCTSSGPKPDGLPINLSRNGTSARART